MLQTRLEPYNVTQTGQELFNFEPGISVIVSPAPSTFIIKILSENMQCLMSSPITQIEATLNHEDTPDLIVLIHHLTRCVNSRKIRPTLPK